VTNVTRRQILEAMLALAMLVPTRAAAQDSPGLPRVAVVGLALPGDQMRAFEDGLRTLGHVDQSTIATEYRSAGGREDVLASVAREAAARTPRVIVAVGAKAALAAQQATSTVPIVAVAGDIVAAGIVKNLGRPEGNVTGLSFFSFDLVLKRFDLLLELAPKVRRITVVVSGRPTPSVQQSFSALERAARRKRVDIRLVAVDHVQELGRVFSAIRGGPEAALLLMPTPDFDARAAEIGRLTAEHRLIAMLPWKEYVIAGGLTAYAPDIKALWRQAAGYVDRILRGAKPGDLPVEQPTKFEFAINATTVKALGLTIPQSLLVRVDHVIE
jgi:putative ABC transport system substrate-binding protein